MKRLLKNIGRDLGWQVINRFLLAVQNHNDIERLYGRAEYVGRLASLFLRSRRRLLLSNLGIALPEYSESQRRRVAGRIARHISRGFAEALYYSFRPELLEDHVRLEDNGVLEDVLSDGGGCIMATGHIGMFPWFGIPVITRGIPFGPIVRDPHDGRVKDLLDDARTRVGYIIIPDRPPVTVLKKSLKVLKAGGALMIAFDMHPAGSGGIEVDFLGRKTPMFSAVVRLAARTRRPIVPGHVLWEPDGMHHRVTYYPPLIVPPEAAREDSDAAREILQQLADWLSGVIRKNPGQWWGIYRRWR